MCRGRCSGVFRSERRGYGARRTVAARPARTCGLRAAGTARPRSRRPARVPRSSALRPERELVDLAPDCVLTLLVQREGTAGPGRLVVGELRVRPVHRLLGDVVRHGHMRVVRELQLAHQRAGRVPHPLLQPGTRRRALDDLDVDDRRQRTEGPRPGQPHRKGAAAGRDPGKMPFDRGQVGRLRLGRREKGDVGGNAVRGRVPEARAPLLEQAAVGLRDRDRNAERYGPHVVLLNLRRSMAGFAPPPESVSRRQCAACGHRPARVLGLSASRAESPSGRRSAPGSRRPPLGPSPRPWPGSSPATRGRQDIPGFGSGTV